MAELTDKLDLKKHTPAPSQEGIPSPSQEGSFLKEQLEIVKTAYPICTDFERNFPSICFALATGVGKTRLMGAFAAYLYLSKGIRNFFVLAPNLTIYNKLIEDFSNTTHPKYVFKGIGEFVHNNPVIITGDNYNSVGDLYKEQEIRINVFNISKISSEMRGGKLPRIKRLSEYLGDSYFNYLSNLEDLVLLMDESHGFRKACHTLYKFDTKTEKDFAAILEYDKAVLKWLRPSRRQFKIYWDHNSRQYHPDFVAEISDAIYMIETKKEGDIETTDVQEKAQAALHYCKHASEFTVANGGKPWKYVLIPHNAVLANMSFDTLMRKYEAGKCRVAPYSS